MSMLVPIALVVGMKDCLQTNYDDVVHCCTKFHVCQLFLYSTLAHFPFFLMWYVLKCIVYQYMIMKTMSSKRIVRILLSISLDFILVSSVVSVSGPYIELHERHCSCFGT